MKGMLTERELERIKKEVETKWSDEWRNNVAIDVDNIVGMTTNSIVRYQVGFGMEYVDIVLEFIAIQPSVTNRNALPTVVTFNAEFTKNYSKQSFGDWSISNFKLVNINKME